MSGAVLAVLGASGRRVRVTRAERRGAAVLSSALALLAAVMMSLAAVAHAQTPPALSTVMTFAEKGDAKAEYDLGVYYDVGKVLPKNNRAAARWYLKSAMRGYRRAEYNLAFDYAMGKDGLPIDWGRAEGWFRRAAAQGYWRAEFAIALAYKIGAPGTPSNMRMAERWYRRAAEQRGAIRWGRNTGHTLKIVFDAYPFASPPGKCRSVAVTRLANSAAPNFQPDVKARRVLEKSPAPSPASHVAPTPAAPAGATDNQQLDRSLQSFWQAYFQQSNAKLVEFGTPALVRPVSFAGPP